MSILYSIFIYLYRAAIGIASLWNPKARAWTQGRKGWLNKVPAGRNSPIWVHCSSAGELEQARPLIDLLKQTHPSRHIHLTIFSPSAQKMAETYGTPDSWGFMPLDRRSNARAFFRKLNPSLIIFIKYEFWYHHLHEAQKRNIPALLSSAVFRPNQPFFQSWGGFFRKILKQFRHIFVQYPDSLALLADAGFRNVSVSGDTRFDRVVELKNNFSGLEWFEQAFKKPVMVAGSTWPEDEKLIAECIRDRELHLILAPHEINPAHIASVQQLFPGSLLFSEWKLDPTREFRVLIIDNVGMLSRLYHYGNYCYIGGGFTRDGIHNCLEAAVWGKPVIFGPRFDKFREAQDLIKCGGAQCFSKAEQLRVHIYQLTEDVRLREKMGSQAAQFVNGKKGASQHVVNYITTNNI